MTLLDWLIIAIYIALMIGKSLWLFKSQRSQKDYFLGGQGMSPWSVGFSLLANQVSVISLIGAPAFVALQKGGGMRWLQYELAIPLAMIFLMHFLAPALRKYSLTSIYEYLGRRFGHACRLTISTIFLLSRALGTGVVLYASAMVLAVVLDISLLTTMIMMGMVAILYTTIGGIKADIYSDVIQLVIIWVGTVAALIAALSILGQDWSPLGWASADRLLTLDFHHHGLGDGETFFFWPMLIGGFFLYVSYYGCDQTQSQRLLTTPTPEGAKKALFINGLLRFPLVLGYCFLGLLLIRVLEVEPQLRIALPPGHPDYLMPIFIIRFLPAGLTGLVLAGIFAASMSSLDSAFNSLSAVTMRDLLQSYSVKDWGERKRLVVSRACTFGWGIFCTLAGLAFARSSATVIEMVNMVGSLFYGPVLAVFLLAIFTRRLQGWTAIAGMVSGMVLNLGLWLFAPKVSWMWWNVAGFLMASLVALLLGGLSGFHRVEFRRSYVPWRQLLSSLSPRRLNRSYNILLGAFVAIFFLLFIMQYLFLG